MNKLVDAYYETFADEPAPPIEDPGNAILDLDVRLTQLEAAMLQMAANQVAALRHIANLNERLDRIQKPAIVLPHGFDPRGH